MEQTLIRRFTIDKIATMYEEIGNKILATSRRAKLTNTDFSIISNNCWGGHVYRRYGLPYTSPTVGIYFFSEDYINFLENLELYIHENPKMIHASQSKYAEILHQKGQDDVPVGVLKGKIEVVFLHYSSMSEAYEKWNRRAERVNMDNLIVKFSEMNHCTNEHILKFEELPFSKKVLLLAKKHENVKNGIIVNKYTRNSEISNDTMYYSSFINLTNVING